MTAAPTVSIGPTSSVAAAPPIGKPRKAAPHAGQNHRPSLTGLAVILLRNMMLSPLWRGYECADAYDASTASAFWLVFPRAQVTVCRIASRSGVAWSPNSAAYALWSTTYGS